MSLVACISVGNSDNKLTQQEFSNFVKLIDSMLEVIVTTKHFFGGSNTYDAWQNVTWLVEFEQISLNAIKANLLFYKNRFKQDSILFMQGIPEFV